MKFPARPLRSVRRSSDIVSDVDLFFQSLAPMADPQAFSWIYQMEIQLAMARKVESYDLFAAAVREFLSQRGLCVETIGEVVALKKGDEILATYSMSMP